jgi:Zn finger protein HypA/HybF involved in hydrogenase expression
MKTFEHRIICEDCKEEVVVRHETTDWYEDVQYRFCPLCGSKNITSGGRQIN